MTASRFFRELTFPLTDSVVLIAIVSFALLNRLAEAAGVLGILLFVVLVPALFRYLLMLLEARIHDRPTPVASIELFNIADSLWNLTPLIPIAASIWGGMYLYQNVAPAAAGALVLLLAFTLPASCAVLAVTRSPLESLNPLAIARLIRSCGPSWVLVPATAIAAYVLIAGLRAAGAPVLLRLALAWYALFLLFTLPGGLLRAQGVAFSLSIPDPVEPDEAELRERHMQERRKVLTHAYGFFARQNRAGCMTHIHNALREEGNDDEAWRWYFGRMLEWECKDAALMLGQDYLSRLLRERRDLEAVKLISRCLLENARFRPLPGDLEEVRALLGRMDRSDLAAALEL